MELKEFSHKGEAHLRIYMQQNPLTDILIVAKKMIIV